MKVSIKFATAVILTAGALIASGSIAQAGEGGAAGSVSVLMDEDGVVEQLSAAAAVGKLNAAAATLTTPLTTSASAYGSGGIITLTGATGTITLDANGNPTSVEIKDAKYEGKDDTQLSVAQANNLTGETTISVKDGTVILPNVKAPGGTVIVSAPTNPGSEPAPTNPDSEPAPTNPGSEPAPTNPGSEPAPTNPGSEPAPTNPG